MNLSRLFRLLLFAAGLLILCPSLGAQGVSVAHHAKTSSPDPAIVQLEKDIPDLMSQADIPGLSIAVLRNGHTAWLRNFEKNVSPMPSASSN
jgi:CubicO group peptidase (beta-lactamase class C family)